jgi:MOSC domain-containing protein YiiM
VSGIVTAVSRSSTHTMSKSNQARIELLAGLGVAGDAHQGETVKHRSRVARFVVAPGQMGENVTTRGVDLLGLPVGARLTLGETATVEVTGLRNPCAQLDGIQRGLMAATLDRDEEGTLVRKAGVMAIVLTSGEVRPGDPIRVELPPLPHRRLEPV